MFEFYMTGFSYWWLIIIGGVIVLAAQYQVSSSYKKYDKIITSKKLSGQEVARMILDKNGLSNVYVVETKGELSDHYDPSRKTVRLSTKVYNNESISSVAVAAHEVGHAIQDKDGYAFMRIRAMIFPVVNLVSYLGYFGLIVSIIFGFTAYINVAILILLVTVLFQIVTLPVEFDASKRAKEELIQLGIVDKEELDGVSKMLFAAALTYVASLISNLLQLVRLFLIANGRD